jgi:flagellar protein FliL
MANSTLETPRGGREPANDANGAEEKEPSAPQEAAPKSSAGIKAWLPLVVALVTMPALAYVTTVFVLLPKLQRGLAQAASPSTPGSASENSAAAAGEPGKTAQGKPKVMVQLNKLLVNVAGTMGTRYLMTSVTLVGNTSDFKSKIDENKDQLMDLASGALSSKTISDLEKPGARNEIRAELMTVFNNALGGSLVQEIFITELAIQ